MKQIAFSMLVAALLVCALPCATIAQDGSWKDALGDAASTSQELREEIVAIAQIKTKASDKLPPLVGTLYQPQGAGPFPVIILSHGSPSRASKRVLLGRYRLLEQIKTLVGQGYAVLAPMRRGYGTSPGEYAESFGYCEDPKYDRTGTESARDLHAALAFVRTRASLNAKNIVLMGQSAGGFASLAAASMQPNGVVAAINFSGGRGGNGMDGIPCRPDAMAKVIAHYASTTRVPVLWLYVENDKYFGPDVAKSWFAAFEAAGGKGKLVLQAPYGQDGHLMFYKAEAIPIWSGAVQAFFTERGLTAFIARIP